MKKNYLKPRTTALEIKGGYMMICYSRTGGLCDEFPEMGTDGEGDYGNSRFWNELN